MKLTPEADLEQCRAEIGAIDREIVALLRRRVDLGLKTKSLKQELGLPILDPGREAAVIRGAVESAREANLPDEPVREIFWRVLSLSRAAQQLEEK
ncbi:MAG TPA: chorismate mutase [Gemmatimonadaceae bacterium]|jgi:chorismate mutase|nr:chorismate mutase [Gemmatimonadaceae bacterium]